MRCERFLLFHSDLYIKRDVLRELCPCCRRLCVLVCQRIISRKEVRQEFVTQTAGNVNWSIIYEFNQQRIKSRKIIVKCRKKERVNIQGVSKTKKSWKYH